MDEITKLYEKKTNKKLKVIPESQQDFSLQSLTKDLEDEDIYLEQVLNQIDSQGIENVGFDEMTRFKSMVAKRIEIFAKLQEELDLEMHHGHTVELDTEMKSALRSIHTFRSSRQFDKTFSDVKEVPPNSFRSGPVQKKKTMVENLTLKDLVTRKGKSLATSVLNSIKKSIQSVTILHRGDSAFQLPDFFQNLKEFGTPSMESRAATHNTGTGRGYDDDEDNFSDGTERSPGGTSMRR